MRRARHQGGAGGRHRSPHQAEGSRRADRRPQPAGHSPHQAEGSPHRAENHAPLEVHGHSHDAPIADPRLRRRATIVLTSILIPLALLTIAGLVWLWPSPNDRPESLGQPYSAAPGVSIVTLPVDKVDSEGSCAATETHAGRVEIESDATCRVPYVTDPETDQLVPVQIPPEVENHDPPEVGDKLRVMLINTSAGEGNAGDGNAGAEPGGEAGVEPGAESGAEAGAETTATFIDYNRDFPVALLSIVYALLVIVVAGWRGFRALIGLAFSFLIFGWFMFPALLAGKPALWVGLVGAIAIMFVVLYFAHGLSARTTTALLGTIVGLFVTAGIAVWATDSASLLGQGEDSTYTLNQVVPNVSLSGIVLCGLFIAGLGVLNDVTITQASAVWELADAKPDATVRELFRSAMRIGRDHIASTVYTIVFAYAGGAIATLLMMSLYDYSMLKFLTTGHLAEEVVRTLVASIGLVIAIPVTTLIGVIVVKASLQGTESTQRTEPTQRTEQTLRTEPTRRTDVSRGGGLRGRLTEGRGTIES